MFSADRLLFDLIGGGLSGGIPSRKRYRYDRGGGIGDAIGRTIMSPQGLTILGGLAIAAYEQFKGTANAGSAVPSAAPSAVPPPFPGPNAPPGPPAGLRGDGVAAAIGNTLSPAGEERARLLITAMVSAAKADGTIDPQERARILGRLAERGASDAERAHLEEEMAQPLDVDRLVSQVQDPVLAAEVYAASLLAIDPDTPAEKAYLATLAARLKLDPELMDNLESRLDTAGA
jgi:uncharacterized membrane protein YebE (DUF533 family)